MQNRNPPPPRRAPLIGAVTLGLLLLGGCATTQESGAPEETANLAIGASRHRPHFIYATSRQLVEAQERRFIEARPCGKEWRITARRTLPSRGRWVDRVTATCDGKSQDFFFDVTKMMEHREAVH